MAISLFHFVLVFLTPALMLRIWVISNGVRRFIRIFEGRKNAIQGGRLAADLEIPGLSSFIKHEILLGAVPYLLMMFLVVNRKYFDMTVSDLDLILVLLTVIIFFTWIAFDIIKSININTELNKLATDTSRLKKIAGNALDGLRFVIHAKGFIKRNALRYTSGVVRGQMEKQEHDESSVFRRISITGLKVLEDIISFPEKVTKKLSVWIKDDLDARLMKRFEKYSIRSFREISFYLVWSLIPAVWVVMLHIFV